MAVKQDAAQKYTILMVHNYYQIPGGEDTVVANEKKLLEEHGHKVILYTRRNSELKHMSAIQKLSVPFSFIYSRRTAKDIQKIIRDNSIDAVMVHNTLSLISPSVYYTAIRCGVPVIQTVHNFRFVCPNALFYRDGHICEDCLTHGLHCAVKHRCYRGSFTQTLLCVISDRIHRANHIYSKLNYICLTEFNRQKLLTLKQIDPAKVFVKPNFTDVTHEWIPYDERADQYVFAGRLDGYKGIKELFAAWKILGSSAPKLIVCGSGQLEEWCRMNMTAGIELKGQTGHDEMLDILAHSKALIIPSKLYEGFPMTIAEAFAVGTPVITNDIGNTGSIVDNKYLGVRLNPLHITEELAQCVKEWNESYDYQVETMKAAAHRYGKEENGRILEEILKQALR